MTILVPTDYATLELAWAAAGDGDVIELEAADAQALAASLAVPAGEARTVRCTAATRAPVTCDDECFTLAGVGSALTIENLRLETVLDDYLIVDMAAGTSVAATACEFVPVVWVYGELAGGTSLFDRCLFTDTNQICEVAGDVDFRACVFVRVESVATILDIEHPTFLDCGNPVGGVVVSCGDLLNPSFVGCSTAADYLVTASSITNAHHHDCTAAVSPLPPGATGTVTGDPLYRSGVDGVTPSLPSPLTGAGAASSAVLDFFGLPFAAAPTIGAVEAQAAAMVTGVPSDLTHVVVAFDGAVDAAVLGDLASWSFATTGARVTPTAAAVADDLLSVTLTVWRELSVSTYVVTAVVSADGASSFVAFTVPAELAAEATPPRLMKIVESLVLMMTNEIHELGGVESTRLVAPIGIFDAVALVESTRGFPQSGGFASGHWHFLYTSVTDGAFHGLTRPAFQGEPVPVGSDVVAVTRAWDGGAG